MEQFHLIKNKHYNIDLLNSKSEQNEERKQTIMKHEKEKNDEEIKMQPQIKCQTVQKLF